MEDYLFLKDERTLCIRLVFSANEYASYLLYPFRIPLFTLTFAALNVETVRLTNSEIQSLYLNSLIKGRPCNRVGGAVYTPGLN